MTVASVKVKKEERADPFLVLQDLKDHAEPLCRPLSRVECTPTVARVCVCIAPLPSFAVCFRVCGCVFAFRGLFACVLSCVEILGQLSEGLLWPDQILYS